MATNATTLNQATIRPSKYTLKYTFSRIVIYAILVAGAAVVFLPFAWTVSTSLKTEKQTLGEPSWIPDPVVFENYTTAFNARRFDRYYPNSFIITVSSVFGQVISSTVVAYGFARFRFPGRNILFFVMLSTMMLPFHILIVPRFILFKKLGWLDTFRPLIVPNYFGGAFSIFLMRQYIMGIPRDLDDAARIDGAGSLQILLRIILPLSRPAIGAVAVFEFMESWRDFMGPLIYLNSDKNYTVPIGLAAFRADYFTEWNLYMAAAATAMIPPLVVFFIAQKYFIGGIQLTGTGATKG